jgi:hypothetical protein
MSLISAEVMSIFKITDGQEIYENYKIQYRYLSNSRKFVEKEALPAEFFQSTDKFNNDFYQKTKKKKLF